MSEHFRIFRRACKASPIEAPVSRVSDAKHSHLKRLAALKLKRHTPTPGDRILPGRDRLLRLSFRPEGPDGGAPSARFTRRVLVPAR